MRNEIEIWNLDQRPQLMRNHSKLKNIQESHLFLPKELFNNQSNLIIKTNNNNSNNSLESFDELIDNSFDKIILDNVSYNYTLSHLFIQSFRFFNSCIIHFID